MTTTDFATQMQALGWRRTTTLAALALVGWQRKGAARTIWVTTADPIPDEAAHAALAEAAAHLKAADDPSGRH